VVKHLFTSPPLRITWTKYVLSFFSSHSFIHSFIHSWAILNENCLFFMFTVCCLSFCFVCSYRGDSTIWASNISLVVWEA
jgi:hypothetical protein